MAPLQPWWSSRHLRLYGIGTMRQILKSWFRDINHQFLASSADITSRKLLKFWAQSYLLGIPEVFVGFRSPDGIIQSTQSLATLSIPRLVRGKGPHAWDSGVCLDFAERFLKHLRAVMAHDSAASSPSSSASTGQAIIWRISFEPKKGISLRRLVDPSEIDEVRNGEDRVGFLPSAFCNRIAGPNS